MASPAAPPRPDGSASPWERALPPRVIVREVGPRDGLQAEAPLPVEARVRLIEAVAATGVPKVEAVSFVSATSVPAMADAALVWARVARRPDVRYSALVPNRRGAEAALEAGGFHSLQAFLGASNGYNVKNVGKTVEESIGDVRTVVAAARQDGVPVEVSISAAFGDPYDGDVPPERVVEMARRLAGDGVEAISLGDTTGMGTPVRVWRLIEALRSALPAIPLNLHLHDTRGTAMANVVAGLLVGVTEFDASVAGLGGSPFAPGANGNLATEDVVHLLLDMGIETGIDLEAVLAASRLASTLVGHPGASQVSKAGPRWPGSATGAQP